MAQIAEWPRPLCGRGEAGYRRRTYNTELKSIRAQWCLVSRAFYAVLSVVGHISWHVATARQRRLDLATALRAWAWVEYK